MRASLLLLPIIAYGLLALIFYRGTGVRKFAEALVKAHLIVFGFIAVSTQLLSGFHSISFTSILIVWVMFVLVSGLAAALLLRQERQSFAFPVLPPLTPLTTIMIGAIVLILATTLATALLYPPNTWDSMTYHMSRVVHWISNGDISFYPTAIPRQNYQMPLAEFAMMHVQLLTNGDWYANLVQWVSFLVLICLSALTAAELGLNGKQQLVAATVIATLPMAIVQASSTQNDLVVSSFVMSFGFFMLRLRDKLSVENTFFAAMAVGLAFLTKGTAWLYCAAIGTALAVPVFLAARSDWVCILRAMACAVCITAVAVSLNAGHFLRNYAVYGRPSSIDAKYYRNYDMSAAALVGNVVRHGALHLGTPSDLINGYLYRAIKALLGDQLNNPKTTALRTSFMISYSLHEDTAGNLIHMLLVLFSLVYAPILWWQGRCTGMLWYASGTLLAAILYCWILKWNPWTSRLQTPLFAMASPLLALAITPDRGRVKIYTGVVIVLCLVLYSFPFALANESRSLVSLEWSRQNRMELYFQNQRGLFRGYENAINAVPDAGTQDIGLYIGGDDWEYPFWALAPREKNGTAPRFIHVGVGDFSRTLRHRDGLPVYVIATRNIETWKDAGKYAAIYTSRDVSVFKKSEIGNASENRVQVPPISQTLN